MATKDRSHVWLIGMMGSGKSAVGAALATRLGRPFHDVDAEVVADAGCSVSELWAARGEAAFRAIEAAVVRRMASQPPAVIATGGGAVLDPRNVAEMRRSGRVVWLVADPDTLAARLGDGEGRPLLEDGGALSDILARRSALYAAAADHVVDTGGAAVDEVVGRIEGVWNES